MGLVQTILVKSWLFGPDFLGVESNVVKYYNDFAEMIIKNCNNLTHFDFYTDYMSEENRNNFIEKFGSKLISVNLENCGKPEVFLSSMKVNNIKKLVINHMTYVLNEICFSKLKSLTIRLLTNDIKLFERFIEGNRDSIEILRIEQGIYLVNGHSEKLDQFVFKMNNLKHLSLRSKIRMFEL